MKLRSILILLVILLGLGVYFIFFNTTEPPPEEEPRVFLWNIEMDEIQHIEIQLPREDKSEAFIKISHQDGGAP